MPKLPVVHPSPTPGGGGGPSATQGSALWAGGLPRARQASLHTESWDGSSLVGGDSMLLGGGSVLNGGASTLYGGDSSLLYGMSTSSRLSRNATLLSSTMSRMSGAGRGQRRKVDPVLGRLFSRKTLAEAACAKLPELAVVWRGGNAAESLEREREETYEFACYTRDKRLEMGRGDRARAAEYRRQAEQRAQAMEPFPPVMLMIIHIAYYYYY